MTKLTPAEDEEYVARAICEADVVAPAPDAPIYIGMRRAKAWEGRVEMARAAIKAVAELKEWRAAPRSPQADTSDSTEPAEPNSGGGRGASPCFTADMVDGAEDAFIGAIFTNEKACAAVKELIDAAREHLGQQAAAPPGLAERLRAYAILLDASATEQQIPAFARKAADLRSAADALAVTPPRQAAAPPANVVAFLLGDGPLDGFWFGDGHPAGKGSYWWRKHLRALAVAPPHPSDGSLVPCPFDCDNHGGRHVIEEGGGYQVFCNACNARGPIRDTPEHAIEEWERRAVAPPPVPSDALDLIARTLFKSRGHGYAPPPHWDQEPNPLRDECIDDARDVLAALSPPPVQGGSHTRPAPAVREDIIGTVQEFDTAEDLISAVHERRDERKSSK